MHIDITPSDNIIVAASPNNPVQPRIPSLCNRVAQDQALVLGFVAENSLPLSITPGLVDLAKVLAKDPKALAELSMDRTSASYKLNYGVKNTIQDEVLEEIRSVPFSLNIDEATSKTYKRILGVLVSYWSEKLQRTVMQHLAALEVVSVTAESLFKKLDELFEKMGLPWDNLISILMDSCAVMRGSKNGLEKLIRDRHAPQMLDIDGDSCHHIHNASKKFCSPFEHWVEGLLSDLHTDHRWSADMRDGLREISIILGIHASRPERYIPHRWLSVLDVSLDTLRLWDAFVIFYYAFLGNEDRATYKDIVNGILEKRGELRIRSKNFTNEGKMRKARIYKKVFFEEKRTLLELHFYASLLPMLKQYTLLFQCKEPKIHRLHDEQEILLKEFLSCFIKPKKLVNRDPSAGYEATSILEKLGKNHPLAKSFNMKVIQAYTRCAIDLQAKLPLDNPVLRTLSCLDPNARGSQHIIPHLKNLLDMFPAVKLTEEEKAGFQHEIYRYASDMMLPPMADDTRVDLWWNAVRQTLRYPTLAKMALFALCPFHGSQVASSFSMMANIMQAKTSSLNVETYEAYEVVKYQLKAMQVSAIQHYSRPSRDSPINPSLVQNLKLSSRRYRAENKRRAELHAPNPARKKATKDSLFSSVYVSWLGFIYV
ncbi:hypothetical protein ABG768_018673 [Culter alburnus]|uniref:HAT C-terminal dimerisation domain-containing protein n=1 Tax=Culter alburnus TaxID=194366 RepID=A0AAW2AVW7_CULAL